MKKFNKGFTLIELLVVIAIIGVLASVVLASLNTARTKAADASVKANLAGARAQAELFYDTGNTYTGVCAAGTGTINAAVVAAASAAGVTPAVVTAGTAQVAGGPITATSTAVCYATSGAWAAQVPLKSATSSTNAYWCVDSTGASKFESAALGATTAVCS